MPHTSPIVTRPAPFLVALVLTTVPAMGFAQASPMPAPGDPGPRPLYDRVARMDSLFFDALFAKCDADRANGMLTADVEFYDDRTGFTSGAEVREGFRRLAANCPAHNGVRRVVLPTSVEVYPIQGVGAMQTGVHHFVERGAATSTTARFVIVWTERDGEWKMSRVMSVDHQIVDAGYASEVREASSSP